ncbi:MAG: undecaprenyl-phosphate glucose phosphotransferase [Eubacterium sp.]|nr:undecaprenyl-phosphate glucose phosphotransferase [Eubacterium sp.]MDD7209127.1 undecaprenyl-phosphate glucose phosphotransferase [Lachnospiraceae bacterium]MDY5498225.1 undecaprenyl-phosphate glucose phosphotransferase [Anaerobutyricum sp.]
MIKENQKYFNRLHVVLDAVVIYGSFCFSYYIRFVCPLFKSFFPQYGYWRNLWQYQEILLLLVPVYLILYAKFNLYKPKRYQNQSSEYANVIKANTMGMVFFFICIIFMKISHVSRSLLFLFYVISMAATLAERGVIRLILEQSRKKGYNLKHVIVIGFSAAAEAYIDRIKANPQWGYVIHGIFDDNLKKDFSYRNIYCIGKIRDIEKFLQKTSMDEVAITLSLKEYYKLGDIVNMCEKSGVHTKFVPDYYKFISTNPVTEDLNGLPVINIRNVPLTNTVNKFVKRLIDIVGSIVCIILFSPIMAIVAILVKKSSPGPIIFCQERVGLHNKPFKMYKFRSMGVQPPSKEEKAWTTHNDPRVTPVGKIIRKTSLDELPQLFNVLKGDMSLIGPRPERPLFVEKFKEEIPRYMIKHQVRPGMTGWAQVCGFRGDTSIEGRIEHDIFYIENWTLSFDIKILFLTIFKGFVNKNAY